MKFVSCHPESFGAMKDKEFTFSDGINVVYGPNEAGKSTLNRFLRAMLFGMDRGHGRAAKDSDYNRYKPWDNPGAYQGSLEVEIARKRYLIERDFLQTEGGLKVCDAASGRELPPAGDFFETIQTDVTESGFVNTVMQSQKGAATDRELAGILQNTIANMSLAKSRAVDVGGALEILNGKLRAMEQKKLSERIAAVRKSIEECERKHEEFDRLEEERAVCREELEKLEAEIDRLEHDDAPVVEQEFAKHRVRYDRYLEDRSKEDTRVSDIARKKRELAEWKETLVPDELLKQEMHDWDEAEARVARLEARWEAEKELASEGVSRAENEKRYTWQSIVAWLVLAAGIGLLIWKRQYMLTIPVGVALLGSIAWYLLRRKNIRRDIREAESELQRRCKKVPKDLQEAREKLGSLVSGKEIQAKERKNIETLAKMEQMSDMLGEREGRLEVFRKELNEEQNELLSYFRTFMPELEKLSEVEIGRIEGGILARSVEQRESLKIARVERDERKARIVRIDQLLEQATEVEQRLLDSKEYEGRLQEERKEDAREAEAIRLAVDTIHSISQDIHDSFGKKLNARMSELAGTMTGGRYERITADENLQVKAGRKGRLVELEKLSAGTIEQIYLALRLAVGETMYTETMPLVFDESFVYYDEARLGETLRLLASLDRQVILCTCSHREEQQLSALGIPFNRVEIG